MAVTRLKRKDRYNKNVSRLEVKTLKLATNLELGSRSRQSTTDQLAKNNAVLAKLTASA
ncbi:MAG: spore protein [Bacteroidota bacterium]